MKLLFKLEHLLCDQSGEEIARAVECANGTCAFKLKSRCKWHGGYRSMDEALAAAVELLRFDAAPPARNHRLSPFIYADYFRGRPKHVQAEAYKGMMAIDPSVECGAQLCQ